MGKKTMKSNRDPEARESIPKNKPKPKLPRNFIKVEKRVDGQNMNNHC